MSRSLTEISSPRDIKEIHMLSTTTPNFHQRLSKFFNQEFKILRPLDDILSTKDKAMEWIDSFSELDTEDFESSEYNSKNLSKAFDSSCSGGLLELFG